jgi:hypothetical protein
MELESDNEVALELTWTGSADLDLYLFDNQEQILGASEQEGTSVEGLQGELSAGQYIVVVNPYSGSAAFELSIECSDETGEYGDDDDDGGRQSSRRARSGCTLGGGTTPPLLTCVLSLFLVGLTRRRRVNV